MKTIIVPAIVIALAGCASTATPAERRSAFFMKECGPVGAIAREAMSQRVGGASLEEAKIAIAAKYPPPQYNSMGWVESVYSVPVDDPAVVGDRVQRNCAEIFERQALDNER